MFTSSAPLLASTGRTFTRYAFAVQYHGGNFLGFVYQGLRGENCIVHRNNIPQSDLRGIESIEGRIRRALDQLVGRDNYANIQVSSRTDRGVHAWRNTFQVEIRPRLPRNKNTEVDYADLAYQNLKPWCPKVLVNGLNFYLTRLPSYHPTAETDFTGCNDENDINNSSHDNIIDDTSHEQIKRLTKRQRLEQSLKSSDHFNNIPINNNDIRILSAAVAPSISIPNQRYDPSLPEHESTNPKNLPWDVRFTASRRTYAYRILHSYDLSLDDKQTNQWHSSGCYYSQPFENDRVWRIHEKESKRSFATRSTKGLDIVAMNVAGQYLVGTHDFTSFRGNGCERSSPVVTLEDVWIGQERYHADDGSGGVLSAVWRRKLLDEKNILPTLHTHESLHLVTVVITGKSFVYHQVRNMVACLVDVGRGKLKPNDVKEILEKRDRSCAPGMAPAQGLFLVDVEHGDFHF